MKTLLGFTLCLLTILSGAPLKARANVATEVYLLPDGRADEAYQSDIEAVLRDRYRLKVDAGTRESILQWFVVDGELPLGLTVRTNGSVVGTPKTYREQPYQFRVKVVDQSVSNSEPLIISLSVAVAPPRLRLTRIEGPALVPLDDTTQSRSTGSKEPDSSAVEEQSASRKPVNPPVSARAQLNSNNRAAVPVEVANSSTEVSTTYETAPLRPASEDPGIMSKVAGLFGLRHDNSGRSRTSTKPAGCAASNVNRIVSDEAHTPLEGDTSTQNTCVQFRNLNTIKYRIEFTTRTTRTEGPDLSSLPFLPKINLTTSTPTTPPKTAATVAAAARSAGLREAVSGELEEKFGELNEQFNDARTQLSQTEITLRQEVESKINQFTTQLQDAHAHSKGVANHADAYLQADQSAKLLEEVDKVWAEVNTAITDAVWPEDKINEVLRNLDEVTIKLEDLRTLVPEAQWKEWLVANEARYNRVRDRVTELKNKITTLNAGITSFNEAKNVLAGWQLIINNVHNQREAAFEQEAFVSCHTDEGEGKSSKLTISKTDRTASNQNAVTRDVLTVNCYSRVAITAGFNFSTLDEKEFSVVQSAGTTAGTTVKEFGFTKRSSFRPNPLALVNIRFTDQPVYNWHASFGAVVDLKGQTGTDVEPIAGVSFSIRRLVFITPFAVHFGRVNKLAGGFKEGDLVPESITTPPIEKAWKVGYTGGVSFRIAPQ